MNLYRNFSHIIYIAWKSLNNTEDYLFLEDLPELTSNLTVLWLWCHLWSSLKRNQCNVLYFSIKKVKPKLYYLPRYSCFFLEQSLFINHKLRTLLWSSLLISYLTSYSQIMDHHTYLPTFCVAQSRMLSIWMPSCLLNFFT